MKLEDVLALIRAGYTREEIAAFENPAPSAPENKPTPVQNEQPKPDATPAPADLKAIIAQAVKEAMQAQAIATSNQPNPTTPTAEECLAAMLR